ATVRSSRSRDPRRRPSFPTRRSSDLIRGVVEEGVSVFKGVPYGGDTSGANRWMPPRDPEPWTGVRDALEYGPQAAQGNGSGSERSEEHTSELQSRENLVCRLLLDKNK